MEMVTFDHEKYRTLLKAVDTAQSGFNDASKNLDVAELERDAFLQEYRIRTQLDKIPAEEVDPSLFDPDEYDALSPREIREIVTGE